MQAKMASHSPLANRVFQRLFAIWVPALGWSVRNLPLRVLYGVGRFAMLAFLLLNPRYRRAVCSNFAHILNEPADSPRVRCLARAMARNQGRYWIDFFHWSERGSRAAQDAIRRIHNLDALDRSIESGRGFIALTAHLGNWEMGGLLLGGRAGEIAVVYVPDRFDVIEAYRSRYRRSAGITEIPITEDPLSALGALRALRSGGVVAVQGDRDFNDTGLAVPFFGKPAYFPRGPATLALISGSPILPVFIIRAEDEPGRPGSGGFDVVVFDPIEPIGDPRDERAVRSLVERTVAIIEDMVRTHPDQWYCFYPFWDDRRAPSAAT